MADRSPEAQRALERAELPAQDMTPRSVGTEAIVDDSRLNALRDADPKQREKLVWLRYDGRKGYGGALRRSVDEHIDVNVPDEHNEAAVHAYLDFVAPGGVLTPKQKEDLALAGIGPDTLQISAKRSYHFHSSQPTPVDPADVRWLLSHPGYAFTEAERP